MGKAGRGCSDRRMFSFPRFCPSEDHPGGQCVCSLVGCSVDDLYLWFFFKCQNWSLEFRTFILVTLKGGRSKMKSQKC